MVPIRERSDDYYQKLDVLEAIHRAERSATLAPFAYMTLCGGIGWFFGAEGEWAIVTLVFGGGIIGTIIGELFRLRALLLRAEFRELSRFGGSYPDDRELTAIRQEIASKRKGRWWPF